MSTNVVVKAQNEFVMGPRVNCSACPPEMTTRYLIKGIIDGKVSPPETHLSLMITLIVI